MSMFRAFSSVISAGLDISEAREVVREGLQNALSTMEGMVGNTGQETVYNDYVQPAFISNAGPIQEGWNEVDIGEYMDFMGDIVGEGNDIMSEAYDLAQEILSELEEALEGAGDEDYDEDFEELF